MKCQRCQGTITEEDIAAGNYREGYGGDNYHEICPGTDCFVCGKEIDSLAEATQTMAGTWRHKSCKPEKVRIPRQTEEKAFDKEAFARRIIKKER